MTNDDILSSLNFPEFKVVKGRSSIADCYPSGNRCGIYILLFANGDYYCGQAIDVTRRFIQHSKKHPDIVGISFKKIEADDLNRVEQECIHRLERLRLRMRNISLMSIVEGERDFDLIMPDEQQQKWVSDLTFNDLSGQRVIDDSLRYRYHSKYLHLLQQPEIEQVIQLMYKYVQNCIPGPRKSEISFWCCTCLPENCKDHFIYSRINIYLQEVLTIKYIISTRQIIFSFHLTKSTYQKSGIFQDLRRRIFLHGLITNNKRYDSGGQDQFLLSLVGPRSAFVLLDDPNVKQAIREFNLRLMRKGPCLNSHSHCLDLADRLVEGNNNLINSSL